MRVSYSMLSAWESRDFDAAIAMYFSRSMVPTQPMIEGSALHEEWEEEVKRTKKLPVVFGARELNNPEPEFKIVKKLNSWLTLSGVIDLRDLPIMYEYKSGKSPSSAYARGKQHLVYQILDPRLKIADYFTYNQHTEQVTFERVHLNEETLIQGVEWVISLASDMKATLEDLGYDTSSHDKFIAS